MNYVVMMIVILLVIALAVGAYFLFFHESDAEKKRRIFVNKVLDDSINQTKNITDPAYKDIPIQVREKYISCVENHRNDIIKKVPLGHEDPAAVYKLSLLVCPQMLPEVVYFMLLDEFKKDPDYSKKFTINSQCLHDKIEKYELVKLYNLLDNPKDEDFVKYIASCIIPNPSTYY